MNRPQFNQFDDPSRLVTEFSKSPQAGPVGLFVCKTGRHNFGFAIAILLLSLSLLANVGTAQDTAEATDLQEPKSSPLPAWVERGSYQDGDDHYVLVETESGHVTVSDAYNAIIPACQLAIERQISSWTDNSVVQFVSFDEDYIRKNLVVDDRIAAYQSIEKTATESSQQSTLLYRGYALLKFSTEFRTEADARQTDIETKSRLIYTGVVATSVLGLLMLMFSYLRLDRATRGFYTSRLQSFFVAAILMLALLIIWCTQYFNFL